MPRQWFGRDNNRKHTRTIGRKRNTVSVVLVAMGKSRKHREKRYWSKRLRKASYARWNRHFRYKPTSDSTGIYFREIQKIYKIFLGGTIDRRDETIDTTINTIDTAVNTMDTPVNTMDTPVNTMDTAVETTELSMTASEDNTPSKSKLEGSRLINLYKLDKAIFTISEHSASCGAPVHLIDKVKRNGLASTLLARCTRCQAEFQFDTCEKVELVHPNGKKRLTWEYNAAVVMGEMSTGGGHASMEELFGALGVPAMTKKTFIDIERSLGISFEHYLNELILQAGKEEKLIAEQNGKYNEGIPSIFVVVDAGWSKRTHKHSYNANSGVGVIFGATTKEILYIGVRNKYCAACSIAKKQGIEPSTHWCFHNWSKSSTSMESDIIASGFKLPEQMHGLRYTELIGDGDSSVLHIIQTTVLTYGRHITV